MHPDLHGEDVHDRIRRLAAAVGEALRRGGVSAATVESCTGGWIAKAITDVPGSSAWFEAGLVTYADEAKSVLAGVPPETIARHGAVSRQTVEAMAGGVLERWPAASLSVAVSGVAGPGGGSVDKPVGLVWFAWGDRRGDAVVTETDVMRFPGDRDAVRGASVLHALDGLLSRLA